MKQNMKVESLQNRMETQAADEARQKLEAESKRQKEEDELVQAEGHLYDHFDATMGRRMALLGAAHVDLETHALGKWRRSRQIRNSMM